MISIYIELPSELYVLLQFHLENSQDDLNKLVAQAIAQQLLEKTK